MNLHARGCGIFDELDINFGKKFNFIVGPNGCGKTSILKLIAFILKPSNFIKEMRYKNSTELWLEATIDHSEYRIGIGNNFVKNGESYRNASLAKIIKPPPSENMLSVLVSPNSNLNFAPLILGAYRKINYKKIIGMSKEEPIMQSRENYRKMGFLNLLGTETPDVKQWMINRYFEMEKDWAKVYKKNWDWIVMNLPTISPHNAKLEFKEINRDLEPQFILNGIDCYIEELSAGFQSFLSLIFAIVEWIEKTNEEETSFVREASGTVIIDEIDVHLHPEWQLTIRDSLNTIFPKLQFILTTHSPHIIASAQPGELIILPKLQRTLNTEPIDRSYSGWSTDEILEDIMGVTNLDNKIYVRLVNEALDNIQNKDSKNLKLVLEELEKVVNSKNTIVQALKIELAKLDLSSDNND